MAARPDSRRGWRAITRGGVALVFAILLSSCNGSHHATAVTLPTYRIHTQIVLSTTHVVAGHHIDAVLVVRNPGPRIDLTAISHRCRPVLAIYLSNSHINNQPVIALNCSPRPFVVLHGTTRLRTMIPTTYSSCQQGPGGGSDSPQCLPGGEPPLPRGSYEAVETLLPMPMPKPVAVTLTG
jgi:hypothetical protein